MKINVLSIDFTERGIVASVVINGLVVRGFVLRCGQRGQFLNAPATWDKSAGQWRDVVDLTTGQRGALMAAIVDAASVARLTTGAGIVHAMPDR
jgi:hypothetical protein